MKHIKYICHVYFVFFHMFKYVNKQYFFFYHWQFLSTSSLCWLKYSFFFPTISLTTLNFRFPPLCSIIFGEMSVIQHVLFLVRMDQTCITHPISSLCSSMLPLISVETIMSLLTCVQLYLSIKPLILLLNAFVFPVSFSTLTFGIIFIGSLNQTACFWKVNILWTPFVFDHFLHFLRLSYVSFITSHKNYFFASREINPCIRYYVSFWAGSHSQPWFSMHFLQEITHLSHCFCFHLGSIWQLFKDLVEAFCFGSNRYRLQSEREPFCCFYFISNPFLR